VVLIIVDFLFYVGTRKMYRDEIKNKLKIVYKTAETALAAHSVSGFPLKAPVISSPISSENNLDSSSSSSTTTSSSSSFNILDSTIKCMSEANAEASKEGQIIAQLHLQEAEYMKNHAEDGWVLCAQNMINFEQPDQQQKEQVDNTQNKNNDSNDSNNKSSSCAAPSGSFSSSSFSSSSSSCFVRSIPGTNFSTSEHALLSLSRLIQQMKALTNSACYDDTGLASIAQQLQMYHTLFRFLWMDDLNVNDFLSTCIADSYSTVKAMLVPAGWQTSLQHEPQTQEGYFQSPLRNRLLYKWYHTYKKKFGIAPEYILIPMHTSDSHWSLLAMHTQKHRLGELYDSMPLNSSGSQYYNRMLKIIYGMMLPIWAETGAVGLDDTAKWEGVELPGKLIVGERV
jgi:hypothetical protein